MYGENIEYSTLDKTFYYSFREKTGHYSMSVHHFHKEYEIYYLLQGERYYFINNRTFHIKKGDIVLINVQDLHRTIDAGVPDHKRILINFSENFVSTEQKQILPLINTLFMKRGNVVKFDLEEKGYIENIFRKMEQEIRYAKPGFIVCLQALLMQLLVFTVRYSESDRSDNFEHPSPLHEKASTIVEFINKYYMEPISLKSVSERFYISQYYLSRIFKEATGFTFVEYVNSVRIKESQKLLRETKLKVIDIAEKVGFGSIAHFGRVFKGVTNQAPMEYRKLNKYR